MNLLGFLHTEKSKKNFFDQPNNQKPKTKKLNKSHFQGFLNSQSFFMKISWIGPWVSRIDWCKGHWFCSTHMAVRLANISSKTGKKCNFCVLDCFWAHVGQPHNHIGWATPMAFLTINSTNPRTNPWHFHKKILRIGGAGQWGFFESAILNLCFFPMKMTLAFIWGIIYFCNMDGFFRILKKAVSELICTRLYIWT